MADNEKENLGGSIFTSLLTVLFIGLKLTGYIHWSWWWVLSPLWIGLAFAVALLIFGGLVIGLGLIIRQLTQSRRRK